MMKQKLILLVNLGSPEQLSVGAIRKFLRSFYLINALLAYRAYCGILFYTELSYR